jgi:hypothetical protein
MLKTKRIGLIVTVEEKKWVVELARLEGGLSQAALLRRLIHKAAVQNRLITDTKFIKEKDNEHAITKS